MTTGIKTFSLVACSFLTGAAAYALYKYWKRRQSRIIDEGFEDVSRIEESPVKKVLILGLQGAGKSSLLQQLISPRKVLLDRAPTEPLLTVHNFDFNGTILNFWEVGGTEQFRPYWGNFYDGTDVLVFVVDSADLHALSLAVREVAGVLDDPRLAKVPVVVVAHKQDLPDAMPKEEVAKALDLGHRHHPATVIGTSTPPSSDKYPSIVQLKQTLLRLCAE